jgi:hypothetical protein
LASCAQEWIARTGAKGLPQGESTARRLPRGSCLFSTVVHCRAYQSRGNGLFVSTESSEQQPSYFALAF